ncbi:MAG: hypothetical protein KAH20_06220 [Methylococcales bacterium]|nr:hypothetical protein [Methylococcales bacterium]
MSPQINHGDYVVLLSSALFRPWPGMKIVFNHPSYGSILKYLVKIDQKKKTFSAQGLSDLSIDTKKLKNMPLYCIKGIVIWRFSKKTY